ncbi:MAG: addiction module protein [Thermoguttaceae bacterium]|jgi:putative addiction module component (TIGR02574 family)
MPIKLEELRKLPIADKLRIVEQLWEDIAASAEPFPLQAWHKEEAQRRAEELDRTPEIALTREEVWKRVGQCDG